jgi:RNA polymerase sigma-70 factor (ECF subfamily)
MSPTSVGSNQLHEHTFDAGYLARLRARDPGTLAHFYDFFNLPVRNKIRHRCRREDADDLAQDVFVAALKRIDAGEPEDPAKLPVYILGICRRVLLRHWNKREKNAVDVETVVLTDVQDAADDRLIEELQARKLREVVRTLPPRYRDAIERVYLEEQARADIASENGLSRSTLRLRVCRALKRLRKELHSHPWEPIYGRSKSQPRARSEKRHLRRFNPDVP